MDDRYKLKSLHFEHSGNGFLWLFHLAIFSTKWPANKSHWTLISDLSTFWVYEIMIRNFMNMNVNLVNNIQMMWIDVKMPILQLIHILTHRNWFLYCKIEFVKWTNIQTKNPKPLHFMHLFDSCNWQTNWNLVRCVSTKVLAIGAMAKIKYKYLNNQLMKWQCDNWKNYYSRWLALYFSMCVCV